MSSWSGILLEGSDPSQEHYFGDETRAVKNLVKVGLELTDLAAGHVQEWEAHQFKRLALGVGRGVGVLGYDHVDIIRRGLDILNRVCFNKVYK